MKTRNRFSKEVAVRNLILNRPLMRTRHDV